MNVIKQIVGDGEQSIKMIVRDNERGPQGEQGEPGVAATITAGQAYSVPSNQQPSVQNTGTSSAAVFDFYIPKGEKGEPGTDGKDGAIHYTAGVGITITDENVINATGEVVAAWGGILGDIADQTDLQQEFAKYTPTTGLATVATTGAYSDLTGTPNLATVATSGAYSDLTGTPTIPAAQVQSDWSQADNTKVDFIKNKPSIPTVNNATLTIQQNGTDLATFTANSATDATANISASVITMTDTDPGEGAALAANSFIAVYNAN